MLSCSCDHDDYAWLAEPADDFSTLDTVRGRKCFSCGEWLPVGSTVLCFIRWRDPRSDYEESRFGCEVPMPNIYYCEECGGLYLSLTATGLCVIIGDMREAIQEYWDMTGFDPAKYEEVQRG